MHPVAAVAVPVRDLDHDRDAAARVGRGAPQAPRRDRHRRRSAQPDASSGSGGCSSATSGSTSGSRRDDANVRKYARDLPPDRLDRFAFDYALARPRRRHRDPRRRRCGRSASGCSAGFLAAGLHAVLYVMLAGAINAVGHTVGKQPYENSATNLQSLALVTGGEGLHNNHHAAPTSARFALQRGEIDPGWWLVRVAACVCTSRTSATTTSSSRPLERLRPCGAARTRASVRA